MNINTNNQQHGIINEQGVLNINGNDNKINVQRFKGTINIMGNHNTININFSDIIFHIINTNNIVHVKNSQVKIDIKNTNDQNNNSNNIANNQMINVNKQNVDTSNYINQNTVFVCYNKQNDCDMTKKENTNPNTNTDTNNSLNNYNYGYFKELASVNKQSIQQIQPTMKKRINSNSVANYLPHIQLNNKRMADTFIENARGGSQQSEQSLGQLNQGLFYYDSINTYNPISFSRAFTAEKRQDRFPNSQGFNIKKTNSYQYIAEESPHKTIDFSTTIKRTASDNLSYFNMYHIDDTLNTTKSQQVYRLP